MKSNIEKLRKIKSLLIKAEALLAESASEEENKYVAKRLAEK